MQHAWQLKQLSPPLFSLASSPGNTLYAGFWLRGCQCYQVKFDILTAAALFSACTHALLRIMLHLTRLR